MFYWNHCWIALSSTSSNSENCLMTTSITENLNPVQIKSQQLQTQSYLQIFKLITINNVRPIDWNSAHTHENGLAIRIAVRMPREILLIASLARQMRRMCRPSNATIRYGCHSHTHRPPNVHECMLEERITRTHTVACSMPRIWLILCLFCTLNARHDSNSQYKMVSEPIFACGWFHACERSY